jgi:hypothetical protein
MVGTQRGSCTFLGLEGLIGLVHIPLQDGLSLYPEVEPGLNGLEFGSVGPVPRGKASLWLLSPPSQQSAASPGQRCRRGDEPSLPDRSETLWLWASGPSLMAYDMLIHRYPWMRGGDIL